jgi:hypothetical protein
VAAQQHDRLLQAVGERALPAGVRSAAADARRSSARSSRGLRITPITPSAVIRAGTSVSSADCEPARIPANIASPTTTSVRKFAALVTTKKATVRRAM